MDMQTIFNNAAAAQRAERMKTSTQLSLGELILKLEAIPDKTKLVAFDFGNMKPVRLDSWRGVYAELALQFEGESDWTVEMLLSELKDAVGKEFTGYKGGEFLMGRGTPIWVAQEGSSGIDDYKGLECASVGVVDIEDGDIVTVITAAQED